MERQKLLAIATALALGNVCFFGWRFATREQDMKARWIVFMPELEASQRKDPTNFLRSSEFGDPRYPIQVTSEVGHPLMKAAADCGAGRFFLSTYNGPQYEAASHQHPMQMPDRLFVEALTPQQQRCIRQHLPRGYVLAALAQPETAKRIGWDVSDLKLSPPAFTNQQVD